ncbi:hypothetical protein [Neisseria lactamica]|uniref:hypothetical protein n=1 Tax=Neisseria lactamica TaxID=486 RepID=UPI001863A14A|nr:hypothetical protein [Neisseria lactamica]
MQTTVKYEGLLLEFQAGALPASDVPVIQGWAADTYSLMSSFAVSVICISCFLRCTDIGRTNNLFLEKCRLNIFQTAFLRTGVCGVCAEVLI